MKKLDRMDTLDDIKLMLQSDNIDIQRIIKQRKSHIYVISDYLKNTNICVKFYFDSRKNSVMNEFNNMNLFYNYTKGKYVTAPRPLIFDVNKGVLAYEFVEGCSLREFIFNSKNDRNSFEDILKLTAKALSEFHEIFGIEASTCIDINDYPQIKKSLEKCDLKGFVRPFIDFSPRNIIVSSYKDKYKIYLIDFPNKYDFYEKHALSEPPHKDLAYFLYHMLREGGYPKFFLFKKYKWNTKNIIELFLNTYFEKRLVKLRKEDIYILNYFFNEVALKQAKMPYRSIFGTEGKERNIFLKFYSPHLLDIISKSLI